MKRGFWAAFAVVGAIWSLDAVATERGDWLVRVGAHYVDPKSDNNEVVSVDSATSMTFDVTYMVDPHWGVELLAAWPYEHDIHLNGGPKVGDTKQLPPTLSVVYNFLPQSRWRPYAGIGVNWTIFFDENLSGPLAGADLSLEQSVGVAYVVGVDIDLNDRWFCNFDVRYINIDTDATVHPADNSPNVGIGSVQIDPWAFGANVGYRLRF
jgi:outer membrane protein